MSRSTRLVFAALIVLAGLGAALAAALPALTGRVNDTAGMIGDAAEAALTQTLAAFEAKSSDQIVVATIPSLDGEAIEPFANRLFREWGLGQAGENNGVLLLVSRNDRKIRIEVGYGLEGTLTDLHSKLIIENTIVPAFRAGDFTNGITRAADDIIMVLSGDGAELEKRAERNAPSDEIPPLVILVIAVFAVIFISSIIMSILATVFGKRIGPGRYIWLGMEFSVNSGGSSSGGGRSSSSGGGWSSSSSSGGFSGGGGSSGGGGASGGW